MPLHASDDELPLVDAPVAGGLCDGGDDEIIRDDDDDAAAAAAANDG